MTISQMLREAIQASQQCIVPERHTIKNFLLDIPHLRMRMWCIFFTVNDFERVQCSFRNRFYCIITRDFATYLFVTVTVATFRPYQDETQSSIYIYCFLYIHVY